MAPLKISTKISPALHPGVLSHRESAMTGRTKNAFAAGQSILHKFYETQSLILNAREAEFAKIQTAANLAALQKARTGKQRPGPNMVMRGATIELTLPPSDAKVFNDAASEAFTRTASHYDVTRKSIEAELDQLVAERASKTTDPNAKTQQGIAAAAEIRAHLKTLPHAERVTLIREQIKAGNARVAAAVVDSEPFLSGLDAVTHKTIVEEVHSQFAHEETSKIAACSAVLKSVDDAAAIAIKAFGDALVPVVGASTAAEAALSALKTGGSNG